MYCSFYFFLVNHCVLFRRRKHGERDDLSSELSGKHFGLITMPWFQDDLGVVGPEFQAGRANGKHLTVS